ncbi:predicted protein [Histoplasma mississippiense (nom. inval.)]|uniref:predicted protein n=1 Tax=Ajellomyces capsulatus (strain NAm1 / WU24) TaxID=2059318 RepID=UPI000157C8DD|nr:predicted protein [Histoplasma mississippiense (nom. inval.)]EDN08978.1 predicted protein [Histoplasma mississippiense (nom. inval.)]
MDKPARAAQRQIDRELRDAKKAQEQKEKEERAAARQQSRLWGVQVARGSAAGGDGLSMNVVEAASDASFADNSERRSTEGYIFKLFEGPVDWKSKRQRIITTSTTEAELLAISQAGKESIWWKRFFDHLGFDPGHKISIQCDNRQTVGILTKEDPSITTKLRHVDIYGNWLRERIQSGDISVRWTPTTSMPADGLTKPLSQQKQREFIKQIGLVDITDLVNKITK